MSYTIRLQGIEIGGEAGLVLSALQLFDEALNRIDLNASLSCSHSPVSGTLANLQNEDDALICRFSRADVLSPGFFIDYTFAQAINIGGIRLGHVSAATSPCRITIYGERSVVWDLNGIQVLGLGLAPILSRNESIISKVPVLLWSDGTGIKERSPASSRVWTAQGAASEVQSASAVDMHTLRFAATGSYLTTAGTPDLELTGDWTIEMRFKTSKTGEVCLLDKYQSASSWQLSLVSGLLHFYSGGYISLGARNLADGQYHDIAVMRQGNVMTALVDEHAAEVRAFTGTLSTNGVALSVGAQVASRNASYDFEGDIDYVRVTNGVARYGDSFTALRSIPVGGGKQIGTPRLNTRASTAVVALTGDVVHGNMKVRTYDARTLLDAEFGGSGRIDGSVARKGTPANVPLKRRVRLHRSRDGYLARETWSKADGSYEFRDISTRYEWDVIAWDHELQEFSTVANNQLAEVTP